MLVLTRKRTETIKIGEDVVITVIHTSRGSVKLGIQAPANVRVLRAELDHHSAAPTSNVESSDETEMPGFPVFSAEGFLHEFDGDYIADLEDQALMCSAQ